MEAKKKVNSVDELEKELKTLVSKMKDENSALNKILSQLNAAEAKMKDIKANESNSNQ